MEKSTMQTIKKVILLLSLIPMFLISNCVSVQEPPRAAIRPDFNEKQQNPTVANRFQESALQKPTVVESAMELSQQYAKLSEEAAVLRQQNRDLTGANQLLEEQVVALDAQLQQAQKELAEANDVVISMQIELNSWKTDILGFRDEIRNAETAQLEALLKILTVLGGEVKVASLSETNQSKP
jgi:chromosome segregation ATPase